MRTMRTLAAIAVIATGLGVSNDAMAQDPMQMLHDVQVDADRAHRLAATASMRIRAIDARVATMETADPVELRRIVTGYGPAMRDLQAAIAVLPEDTTLAQWVTQVSETTARVEQIEEALSVFAVGTLLVLGDHEIRLVGVEERLDAVETSVAAVDAGWRVWLDTGLDMSMYGEVEGIRSGSAKGVRLGASLGYTNLAGHYAGLRLSSSYMLMSVDQAFIGQVGLEGGVNLGEFIAGPSFMVGFGEYGAFKSMNGYSTARVGPMITPGGFIEKRLGENERFRFRLTADYTVIAWEKRVTSHVDTTRVSDTFSGLSLGATVGVRF